MTAEDVVREAEDHMNKSVEATRRELTHVRTGKATPVLLDGIRVDYYGSPVPLNQLATVAAPEARLITVQPFDKTTLGAIEKAIQHSELGLNPSNDGNVIRIPVPPLTEERRKELVKVVRGMVENGRVAVRNVRHQANDRLKNLHKQGDLTEDQHKQYLKQVQDLTDAAVAKLDEILKAKEAEVMEV